MKKKSVRNPLSQKKKEEKENKENENETETVSLYFQFEVFSSLWKGFLIVKMVVIHVKRGEADGFLYETSCSVSNDTLIRELVDVWNMRLRLMVLSSAIRDLAKYGPMKPPDKAGLDEIEEEYNGVVISRNPHYSADPTGQRTGNGVGPQLSETMERVALDAEGLLDKANVQRRLAITLPMLQEKLDNIRGAVTMGSKNKILSR